MSLLLKALKQAEQDSGKPAVGDANLDLEPMMDTPFSVQREWVQPNDNEADASLARKRPGTRLALPRLGLVPATALIAVLIAIGYGIYLYLAIARPSVLATPAIHPRAPRLAQTAETAIPVQPAAIEPGAIPRARESAPSILAGAPSSPATSVHARAAARDHPHSLARRTPPELAPQRPLPALQSTIPAAELEAAYQAYRTGDLEQARQLYGLVAGRDKNPDALLGLAAIAMLQGRPADGIRFYRQVLDVDPRNSIAQAALLDALGTTDNEAAELQLKAQIQQAPSAYLYYALGNLYADQKRWSDAEAAYFEAFKREPANADYAFNLAVSLDHIQQRDAALRNYESALKLATPESRFKHGQAETRIEQLRGR